MLPSSGGQQEGSTWAVVPCSRRVTLVTCPCPIAALLKRFLSHCAYSSPPPPPTACRRGQGLAGEAIDEEGSDSIADDDASIGGWVRDRCRGGP